MKNFVIGLLLIAAVTIGVGVYRGWFSVNKAQIEQDEQTAKTEIQHIERQVQDKAADLKRSATSKE